MSKNPKSKDPTMLGGKNVADASPPRQKPPKADNNKPESPETTTPDAPEKPTE